MNDTVAVALITSLSTLAAAGSSGAITAWLASRQLRHQRALAGEERATQRASVHEELRRDAYERFLARADAAYRTLDEAWLAAPPTTGPDRDAGFAARRALDEAHVRVLLVGPDEVASRGADVLRGVGDEFRMHRRVVDAHPGAAGSAADLDREARRQAVAARGDASRDFIVAGGVGGEGGGGGGEELGKQ
jgi:hypothetical protein